MTDRIRLTRIGVFAFHGGHEAERQPGQRFHISVDCALDLAAAGVADDIGESVDYAVLAERVQEIAVTRSYRTLEGLAEAIAAACLMEFVRIDAITVTVENPAAAIPAILDGVAVSVTRERSHG